MKGLMLDTVNGIFGLEWVEPAKMLSWLRRTAATKPPAVNVTLYTREGCHLCDEAVRVLLKHGIEPELVDIDADDLL